MTEQIIDDQAAASLQRGYDLHRAGQRDAAEPCYRAALRLRPELPAAWCCLGLLRMAAGALEDAEQHQREALRLDPALADAHNGLGMVHYQLGRVAEAENCFRGCLRLSPAHSGATLNLAVTLQSCGRPREAEASYRDALRLGADAAQVHSNFSVLLRELGCPEEAEANCRDALRLRPDLADAQANLAMVLLLTGRWAEAWPYYEARWQTADLAAARCAFVAPLWTGEEPVADRTILLHAEQGLGDTLQFCRYASLLAARGARVVLQVQPLLVRLLARLPGIAQVVAQGDALPDFDLHCPLMSLPRAFGTTPDTVPGVVPYLTADPVQQAAWRDGLAVLPGRRVGLVWAGSARALQPHAAALDRRRSMRLADMAPLASVRGCSFVSLQLGPPATQLNERPEAMLIYDVAERLGDFADTAAVMANLDLVITVDTAAAHLAGALGRPVWLLNRFDTCWRWLLNRDDSPWYPTLRQFRQEGAEGWADVMQRVAQALDGDVA